MIRIKDVAVAGVSRINVVALRWLGIERRDLTQVIGRRRLALSDDSLARSRGLSSVNDLLSMIRVLSLEERSDNLPFSCLNHLRTGTALNLFFVAYIGTYVRNEIVL